MVSPSLHKDLKRKVMPKYRHEEVCHHSEYSLECPFRAPFEIVNSLYSAYLLCLVSTLICPLGHPAPDGGGQ